MADQEDQLAALRAMRDHAGAALDIAERTGDTLLSALFHDLERTLAGRIGAARMGAACCDAAPE